MTEKYEKYKLDTKCYHVLTCCANMSITEPVNNEKIKPEINESFTVEELKKYLKDRHYFPYNDHDLGYD
jgi:hypothetical protein